MAQNVGSYSNPLKKFKYITATLGATHTNAVLTGLYF